MVEEDYLDRANIDLIRGEIKSIDVDKKEIVVKGMRQPIKFEKTIIAWGSEINKLSKAFTNVYYIEDRFSHAKIHNELIKSKKVLIMGSTFDAIQIAQSCRDYLDNYNYYKT